MQSVVIVMFLYLKKKKNLPEWIKPWYIFILSHTSFSDCSLPSCLQYENLSALGKILLCARLKQSKEMTGMIDSLEVWEGAISFLIVLKSSSEVTSFIIIYGLCSGSRDPVSMIRSAEDYRDWPNEKEDIFTVQDGRLSARLRGLVPLPFTNTQFHMSPLVTVYTSYSTKESLNWPA